MSSPLKPLSRPGAGGSTLPPGFLAQTRVPEIYAAVITVTVACTIAVFLRFLCRRMVKAGLWWDDWTMLAALLFEWALSGNLLYDTANLDFCRHIELMQPWQIKPFGKVRTQHLNDASGQLTGLRPFFSPNCYITAPKH